MKLLLRLILENLPYFSTSSVDSANDFFGQLLDYHYQSLRQATTHLAVTSPAATVSAPSRYQLESSLIVASGSIYSVYYLFWYLVRQSQQLLPQKLPLLRELVENDGRDHLAAYQEIGLHFLILQELKQSINSSASFSP
jgi:hypothetical protein